MMYIVQFASAVRLSAVAKILIGCIVIIRRQVASLPQFVSVSVERLIRNFHGLRVVLWLVSDDIAIFVLKRDVKLQLTVVLW